MIFPQIRPQDLHARSGGFTSAQRTQGFNNLGGNFQTDEAGHILANTVGWSILIQKNDLTIVKICEIQKTLPK